MAEVQVEFKFMDNGWRYEKRTMTEGEVKTLLNEATVIDTEFTGCFDLKDLGSLVLRLKDGRKCVLTEEHNSSWEGSSEGWITIFVSEDWT